MPGIQPCLCDCCRICTKCCHTVPNFSLPKRLIATFTCPLCGSVSFDLTYVPNSCQPGPPPNGLGCQWQGCGPYFGCCGTHGDDFCVTIECGHSGTGCGNFVLDFAGCVNIPTCGAALSGAFPCSCGPSPPFFLEYDLSDLLPCCSECETVVQGCILIITLPP